MPTFRNSQVAPDKSPPPSPSPSPSTLTAPLLSTHTDTTSPPTISSSTQSAAAASWIEDAEADLKSRELIISSQIHNPGDYTAFEDSCFERGLRLEELVLSSAVKVKAVKTKNSLLQASTVDKDGILHGNASCLIRAPASAILAFYMDSVSNINGKYERGRTAKTELKTLEICSNHRSVFRFSLTTSFAAREFVLTALWRAEGANQYFLVYVPVNHDKAPPSASTVRGETFRAIRLREESPGVTRFTCTFTMDLKGLIPVQITNNFVIPANLKAPAVTQKYFQLIKPASDFDTNGEDATMLAQVMMDDVESTVGNEERAGILTIYMQRANVLREMTAKYSWFPGMIVDIVSGKKRFAKWASLVRHDTDLALFTAKDATFLSRDLARLMVGNTHNDAVNEWIVTHESMQKLATEEPFFRPFITTVVKVVHERPDWGVRARVIFGALLSISDMITDVFMIVQFFNTGNDSAARATIFMISLNMLLQQILVIVQNGRKGKATTLGEMMLVFSCLKPGFDAYRVLKGGKKDPLLLIDPLVEMALSKCIELGVEAIGGSVVQTVILINSPTRTGLAFFSLATSALTMAYTATTIVYDLDTSVARRRMSPQLFGMIPDEGRGLVFILMVLLALFQTAAKVFSVALLASTNFKWLGLWLSVDVGIFIAYKIARRDLVHFIPGLKGALKWLVSPTQPTRTTPCYHPEPTNPKC